MSKQIKFSYYNPNSMKEEKNPLPQWNPYAERVLGCQMDSIRDTNSCTVVALSVVTGRSYKDCYKYMKRFGRVRGRGMTTKEVESAIESMQTYKVVKGDYSNNNRITLNQFVDKHPKGKYYLLHRGHAFAVVDGVVYDHTNGKRRQITSAYRVYSLKEVEEIKNAKK